MSTCICDPTRGHSCDSCDGTHAELDAEPAELGEPCLAHDTRTDLCDRRAEPGTVFCLAHQYLAFDRLPTHLTAVAA